MLYNYKYIDKIYVLVNQIFIYLSISPVYGFVNIISNKKHTMQVNR